MESNKKGMITFDGKSTTGVITQIKYIPYHNIDR